MYGKYLHFAHNVVSLIPRLYAVP